MKRLVLLVLLCTGCNEIAAPVCSAPVTVVVPGGYTVSWQICQ